MAATIQQIESSLAGFAAAWKTNSGSDVGAWFTEDGTLINPFGARADGRDAVSAMYTEFSGTLGHLDDVHGHVG